MIFDNTVTVGSRIANPEQEEIRQLPQFFRSSPDYVYRLGGPVYRHILDAAPLTSQRSNISIDSRLHMLMPGFLPCIGGWHCDDFYRPDGGQPDLLGLAEKPEFQCTHHSIILGEDIAPTLFATSPVDVPDWCLKTDRVYKHCHNEVEHQRPTLLMSTAGYFVTFGSFSLHRGSMSTGRGWRLFVRITESDHYEPLNEIRTQTQVYIQDEANGW